MNLFLQNYEPLIRVAAFFGLFALLYLWEARAPRRSLGKAKGQRWWTNIGMLVIASILVRFVFPTAAAGIALIGEEQQWGVLHMVGLPPLIHILAALLILDLSLYLQHVMFHTLPLLWRFHRVHHADTDTDISTGLRFHPIEILLSMLIKFLTIAALGAPFVAVVIFEVVLNATSMFDHSNIKIPVRIERRLRWFIVTPDMHRIHHSTRPRETNSNFSFNISLWDRLFGTYTQEPSGGQEGMTLGLKEFRHPKWQTLRWVLYMPFVTNVPNYLISTHKDDESLNR